MKTPVENFLNSIYAVTIPMLLFILAVCIKLSALFYSVFEIPVPVLKLSASILLAIAVALTLLTVSVNAKLFRNDRFPMIFAVCSGIMMLFVFKVISQDLLHWSEYVKRIFISVFLATVEYVYSKLFVRKYQEEKSKERQPLEQVRLQEAKENLSQANNRLSLAEEELSIYKKALTCKKCQRIHTSVSQYRTCKHEGTQV